MLKDGSTKKSLSMTYPPITLYPYIANKLSVLMNYKETLPWFHNNFVQMWARKIEPDGYWFDFLYYRMWRFCPSYKMTTIYKNVIKYKWNTIIDFIIDMIDLGYYLYLNINTFYISAYDSYQKGHYRHDIFIYGYDKQNKVLKIADFFIGGKYSYSTVSFHEFLMAYENYGQTNQYDFYEGIFIETFEKSNCEFDINFVANTMNDFLHSKNTSIVSDFNMLDNKEDTVYGIQVYYEFREYLRKLSVGIEEYLDIRPFHMLFDHKTTMLLRIKYMEECKYIKQSDYIYNLYNLLKRECLILRNMVIKLKFVKDIKLYEEAIKKLELIENTERRVLKGLLDSLR